VLAEIDLPTAKHCAPADRDMSILITIMASPDRGPGRVFIGEADEGKLVPEGDEERAVRAAVEAGVRADKKTILIKAEKNVRLRDISRIGSLAVAVPGTDLKLAVLEKE
jgi:biopolymer transport protein ExbD